MGNLKERPQNIHLNLGQFRVYSWAIKVFLDKYLKREVHSSNHRVNLEKLSAAAVGERREEEKKEERKRWRHHSKHQSYECEKNL